MIRHAVAHCHAYAGHGRDAGAETTLANLLESLVQAGWKAEVILADHGQHVESYTHNGVEVHTTTHGTEIIEKITPRTALITHLECSERTSYIGQIHKVPVVQLVHNTMWQTEGYLNEGCNLAVFNTEWVKDFHETGGLLGGNVGVAYPITNGEVRIDFKQRLPRRCKSLVLHPQIQPHRYNLEDKRLDAPHDSVTMVNLFETKGANTFWELARRLPGQRFMAVKGGYGEQIIPDDIPDNVIIIENTPEMAGVYAMSKVILMPSKYESFGRVAIEAASQGVPTVATGTPGLREALGFDGIYCDDWEDVDEWEDALGELLSNRARYADASFNALQRSNYWADRLQPETEAFVSAMNDLVDPPKGW